MTNAARRITRTAAAKAAVSSCVATLFVATSFGSASAACPAFGSFGAVVWQGPGKPLVFSDTGIAEDLDPFYGAQNPRRVLCKVAPPVVGVEKDQSNIVLATARELDIAPAFDLDAFAKMPLALGPADQIEAIAQNSYGNIQLVVSQHGDPDAPRFLTFRYPEYDPAHATSVPYTTPVADFVSPRATTRVTSIAFDAHDNLYVYDAAGEILVFDSDRTGPGVLPVRTIAGPSTGLVPAAAGFHGSRPLALDPLGNMSVANDGTISTFAADADGDAAPLKLTRLASGAVFGLHYDTYDRDSRPLYVLAADGPPGGTTPPRPRLEVLRPPAMPAPTDYKPDPPTSIPLLIDTAHFTAPAP